MVALSSHFRAAHDANFIALGDAIKACKEGTPANAAEARVLLDALAAARGRVDAYRELCDALGRRARELYEHG